MHMLLIITLVVIKFILCLHFKINISVYLFVSFREFNYNYGQYFTLWDRIGGTYRDPFAIKQKASKQIVTVPKSTNTPDISVPTFSKAFLVFIIGITSMLVRTHSTRRVLCLNWLHELCCYFVVCFHTFPMLSIANSFWLYILLFYCSTSSYNRSCIPMLFGSLLVHSTRFSIHFTSRKSNIYSLIVKQQNSFPHIYYCNLTCFLIRESREWRVW